MNEQNLKQLLKQTDSASQLSPLDADHLNSAVRGRLRRRKQMVYYRVLAAAAMITVVCVFSLQKYQSYRKEQRIVQFQQELKELTRRTEQTLALVQNMLKQQQQQDEIRKANRQLARYENSIRREVDEAAFILVYQADRMAQKYNDKETAIEYYNQVIKNFKDTPSAKTAQERLNQIHNQSKQI